MRESDAGRIRDAKKERRTDMVPMMTTLAREKTELWDDVTGDVWLMVAGDEPNR